MIKIGFAFLFSSLIYHLLFISNAYAQESNDNWHINNHMKLSLYSNHVDTEKREMICTSGLLFTKDQAEWYDFLQIKIEIPANWDCEVKSDDGYNTWLSNFESHRYFRCYDSNADDESLDVYGQPGLLVQCPQSNSIVYLNAKLHNALPEIPFFTHREEGGLEPETPIEPAPEIEVPEVEPQAQPGSPGRIQDVRKSYPEMVRIPGGEFFMGAGKDSKFYREPLAPRHKVRIAPFEVSKTEVTWRQWDSCVADGACSGKRRLRAACMKQQRCARALEGLADEGYEGGNRPAITVGWRDAKAYVQWLSKETGKTFRLLSSSEWEYAARAGSRGAYSWGGKPPVCDTSAPNGANFNGCKEIKSRKVGAFQANRFGLFDMHGNAWEWVEDCAHDNYRRAPADGQAWVDQCTQSREGRPLRVTRGGGFRSRPEKLVLIESTASNPNARRPDLGFRVARTLERN